jgi:UDP-GlcNAc:undecaprenyl-phosphate GlcNAc-1-phosphate transferase
MWDDAVKRLFFPETTLAEAAQGGGWPDWLAYFRQFDSYAILFFAAAAVTLLATPVYIIVARRLGWVDVPLGRKQHDRATVTMGGLVIFATVFSGALFALRLENLVGEKLRENQVDIIVLMACTACMVLLGVVDDRHAVRPRVKLMVQALVAVAAVSLGFRVEAITLPWLHSLVLPSAVGVALSLLWIVGITNAINLTDGLDGLAVGVCLLASSVNAVVAVWMGNHYMAVMMVLLAGSLLGFLRYNFHPARAFLGDTGSLALGMYLALASLRSAQKSHTAVLILVPLFALGYPIFDTLLAVGRRMVRGQPLFVSDRDHIHHRLLDRGRTPSAAAIQIYVASIVVSLVCIAAATANHFVLGLGIVGVALMALFSARVLGYLEWGGWAARWSGREETRVLHTAADLARLKIRQAKDRVQLLRGLAVAAREMGCVRIELLHGGESIAWDDPDRGDVAAGFDETADSEQRPAVEMPLDEDTRIRFTLARGHALDAERSQLLEELSRELGERL